MTPLAPWQQRVYDHLVSVHAAGRLGHGVLFAGPAGIGKRAVVERLAQRVLCRQPPASGEPCGACKSCQLFVAGTHPDYSRVSFIPNTEGTKLRTEIIIQQIRELSERLALTPQYGGAQVAVLDPADAINHAAANALLKTLEEPQPGRYLWLLSAHPARLSATIRSRTHRVEFNLPTGEEALAWLAAQGHKPAAAEDALDAARGHPGLAHEWLRGDGLALRKQVASDLDKLAQGTAGALATAQAWVADEYAGLRLRHAADLALQQAARLTDAGRTRRLAAWFDAANRTRDLLRTTVRADLAVTELLLAWRGDAPAREARGGRG
ncbi:DNA polymerase III delta prime subunit [Lysobacter dokdonensis DS-58]|uniref:DNA-directed DNA polymerase n=1 Tax=Lysobacter dokdonensis DS-58 TaxID=1300345 RepID=A0A0A2WGN5_9GAMM|nr:DNA polymerase III subunit delta' [Lysobacter dokdonensis]KGQ18943.1 DNA polymerase III delta prime subunit [Lysobacter dokdonensis DS-58]